MFGKARANSSEAQNGHLDSRPRPDELQVQTDDRRSNDGSDAEGNSTTPKTPGRRRRRLNSGAGEEEAASPKRSQAGSDCEDGSQGDAEAYGVDDAEINTKSLQPLVLRAEDIEEVRAVWNLLITAAGSREEAGEAIFSALFDGAPSLQSLFKRPKAVQAKRFMNGFDTFISSLDDPVALKVIAETFGFGHLNLEVSVARVVIFRDSILDLFEIELGERYTESAMNGWKVVLNYIGGAIIFVRSQYAGRLKLLADSWKLCNPELKKSQSGDGTESSGNHSDEVEGRKSAETLVQAIPSNFEDMFYFNAAVMGFGQNTWMGEVVDCFDAIVTNVSNSNRLQQECDFLVLRIAKVEKASNVHLDEFKACMLAALRSLLPKQWTTAHEVAWAWLWENTERLIHKSLSSPPRWEAAIEKLFCALDEDQMYSLRKAVLEGFFEVAPVAQEYLKQSDTRLHFVIDQVLRIALDVFKDPVKLSDDLSALGLRHVGYGIPTELFAPFAASAMDTLSKFTKDLHYKDPSLVEGMSWSLSLISGMLERTVTEGSNAVMKAINANSSKMLKKALSSAPRGERATWVLNVQVGTQSLSPLYWAIDSGALNVAEVVIDDLLTIRADRQKYYYGADEIFHRHYDIINRLVLEAPSLLPGMLHGLVWRSRNTVNGTRRVNYYVKHLVQDMDREFAPSMNWLVESKDPKIVTHPVIVLVSDTLWAGLVRREFSFSQIWFLFSLLIFLLTQAVLPRTQRRDDMTFRVIILVGRVFTYCVTMARLALLHAKEVFMCYRRGDTFRCCFIPLPGHPKDMFQFFSFSLTLSLIGMFAFEPLLWCVSEPNFPQLSCEAFETHSFTYSLLTMCAMGIHWMLLFDLAVFNTALSAFLRVVTQVMSEMGRFCVAFVFLLVMFATGVSVLRHDYPEMKEVWPSILALFAMTLQVYEDDYRSFEDPALLIVVLVFVLSGSILLLNLLVAMLGCSYEYIYQDSVGYARLKRADVICETIASCSRQKWFKFLDSLKLDEPIEFNEGDVGLAGGIQVLEEATLHPVTHDRVYRFGGSCSPDLQWPDDPAMQDEEAKRFDRLEAVIEKAVRRATKTSRGRGDSSGSAMGAGSSESFSSSCMSGMDDEEDSNADASDSQLEEDEDQVDEEHSDGPFNYANMIYVKAFEEFELEPELVAEAQEAWELFSNTLGGLQNAGEAIYTALLEGAPLLAPLFKTPRAIQANRLTNALHGIVTNLADPRKLKILVETIGFRHLNFQINLPRVQIFRDSILDVMRVELGNQISRNGVLAWKSILNYVGGALIYTKNKYGERLKILEESWAVCTRRVEEDDVSLDWEDTSPRGRKDSPELKDNEKDRGRESMVKQHVPSDFKGMFQFNLALMNLGSDAEWMDEVLERFDEIVTNFSSGARLQEECDLLCMRISKVAQGRVNLAEYKSCMLAALRSLLPKVWSTEHEVAWGWLWENVESLLKATLGKPPVWEKALATFLDSLGDEQQFEIRKEIYARFFQVAPRGQDYFKQSDTRLHFIAERVLAIPRELFKDPWRMADEISALGLRHVGYNIPTELFPPLVAKYIEVLGENCKDEVAIDGLRWSLQLVSHMLVRTINEGSTIVMKAINANSPKAFHTAINCAPRGKRASWCLVVQVGTQTISPFEWSVESCSFDAAEAIILDLLTIRADRERYYYGVEELFTRHPNIIQRIVVEAPQLLPQLLDGLIWRSKDTRDGMRRVNYYVKHLVQTMNGAFSPTLDWIASSKDPKIVSHPVVVLVCDTLWDGIASRQFINAKTWFICSLVVMMLSHAILPKLNLEGYEYIHYIIFVGRLNIYCFTMGRLFLHHAKKFVWTYKNGTMIEVLPYIRVPSYLHGWYEGSSFSLTLLFLCMCTHEPMLWCINDANWPTEDCQNSSSIIHIYSVYTFGAMAIHWGLLVDFAVFNTGLSAFVLVVAQVMSEIVRFIIALVFLLLMFASAISVLEHNYEDMQDMLGALLTLFSITVRLYEHDYRNLRPDAALLTVVFTFVTVTAIILLNLLTAQLNCSYEFIYQASVGFARLNRAEVIVETLNNTPFQKWQRFAKTLSFDLPLEFNEGDVGMSGGVQVLEPAFLNPVSRDRIYRFGGACSPEMPWPQDENQKDEGEDEKFARMEKLIKKSMWALVKSIPRRSKRDSTRSFSASMVSQMRALSTEDSEDWSEGHVEEL